MKNIAFASSSWNKLPVIICAIIIVAASSCNSDNKNKTSFYYSGNKKIEIIIIGDTLGVFLKDTMLNPATPKNKYLTDVIKLADSNFKIQNYPSVGYLENDQFIKLVVNPKKNRSLLALEKEARELKGPKNKIFVSNAGYLVRIKGSNKPMLLTNEIIIQFNIGVSNADINTILTKYGLSIIRKNIFDSLQYTVETTQSSSLDALKISHLLNGNSKIKFAEINFIYVKRYNSVIPVDTYFNMQWTLMNSGASAVEDADIDADKAWDLTMGSENTKIAVIDYGVDVEHYDLANNFSHNRLESPSMNGIDDDHNGFIDDIIGWNFNGNNNDLTDLMGHGTAVLGIANAVGNNRGIIGSCPSCNSIPIRSGHTSEQDALAFGYALARGARIINCSWDYGGATVPGAVLSALERAINSGTVIVFSMANENLEYCSQIPELLIFPSIVFVSRSTSMDSYDSGGWGRCMSVLAPAGVYGSPVGYLKQISTDGLSYMGYNDGVNDQLGCTPTFTDADFTSCFWGTSAAAPLTAGVAGLILSANSTLTPLQVKYLLQDCADKIDTLNGRYSPHDGKSTTFTHGYGRLNAYEAVKIASSNVTNGGRNGVDIFVRDNYLDWGNTEKPSNYLFNPVRGFIPHWKSMDIKVDAPDAAGRYNIPATSVLFDSFTDENPEANKTNKVYVRVHNRGFTKASIVNVKLYWVYAGAGLPTLWSGFPNDITGDPVWNFLGNVTLNDLDYSGASVAGTVEDLSQIATFNFPAPIPISGQSNHYCLVALIDSPEDPLDVTALSGITSLDEATPNFNNITHRNYSISTAEEASAAISTIYYSNPFPFKTFSKISIKNSNQIQMNIQGFYPDSLFSMNANETRSLSISFINPRNNLPAEITIQQEFILPTNTKKKIIGGYTFIIKED